MVINLSRSKRPLKRQSALIARLVLIATSFAALMRHAHLNGGPIRILKDIVATVANFDVVLFMTNYKARHVLKYHPTLLNGSLSSPYLTVLFNRSRRVRRDVLMFHYRYLAERLLAAFYERADNCGILLWESKTAGERLGISIAFEKKHRQEGDLTVSFEMDSLNLYQISFSIVPGPLVGCSDRQVLFVSRIQGVRENFAEIRRATKLCKDIAPPHLLVTAAQAIACELGISLLAGVSSDRQISKTQEGGFRFPFDYDTFWKSCSATQNSHKIFLFPTIVVGKPLTEISADHRRRARHKREFRSNLHGCIRAAFAEKCLTGTR